LALEKYLAELADPSRPIKHSDVTRLSALSPEELKLVESAWGKIEAGRRLQLAVRMAELAEDDLTLDFTAVFTMALKDPDAQVREQGVAGLWECEERHLITAFIKLLQCDPAERVRATAAQGLGKFAALAADSKLTPKDRDRILQVLMETLHNSAESPLVRRRALEAISPISDNAVRQVIQQAYEGQDPHLRRSAIYAMGHNMDPAWLSIIVKEIANGDAPMRYEAVSACGELGEEAAIPHILPLLRDDDLELRLAAIRSLGSIGGSVAKKALLNCLRSLDEAVKEAAQDALEQADYNADPLSFKFQP
jgi:HEAT repeat protein